MPRQKRGDFCFQKKFMSHLFKKEDIPHKLLYCYKDKIEILTDPYIKDPQQNPTPKITHGDVLKARKQMNPTRGIPSPTAVTTGVFEKNPIDLGTKLSPLEISAKKKIKRI